MDTICAISTPHGIGGIAVIRVSGDNAISICQSLWVGVDLTSVKSHTAHLGNITSADGEVLDQAVATVYRAPKSFTGENVVELAVHGSKYVQQQLLNLLIMAGARLAQPGEFTRRAFSAGKLDLAQAEAVADVIAAQSRASHRLAMSQMRGQFSERLSQLRDQLLNLATLLELELDFSEEDVEFASRQKLLDIANQIKAEVTRLANSFSTASAIKDGIPVAIIGATNAGKSSLLNAIVGDERAIVSDIHGTTRDIVEDTITIGDYQFRIMDTAGLRATNDTIEQLGIQRSLSAANRANIIIIVIDSTQPQLPAIRNSNANIITVINKTDKEQNKDIANVLASPMIAGSTVIYTSAKTGEGIDKLKTTLTDIARDAEGDSTSVLVTNARHYEALINANTSITHVIDALKADLSGDLIALDIRQTIHHLSEILGQISSQEILNTVFSRFCIGK